MSWHIFENCVYRIPFQDISSKDILSKEDILAGFDLYDTLIHTASGKKFPKILDDWVWQTDQTPEYLNMLLSDGFVVAIFSNLTNKSSVEMTQQRIETMIIQINQEKTIKYDPYVFIAYRTKIPDNYSKPARGMFDLFLQVTGLRSISSESFFCGDGDDETAEDPIYRRRGSDKYFAQNIGVSYWHPDEVLPPQIVPGPLDGSELIIMVGQQGSGKSTFADAYGLDYGFKVIHQDKFKPRKTPSKVEDALIRGEKVIIDATNPTRKHRLQYIQIAQKYNIPVRIFWASQPGWLRNKSRIDSIPDVALGLYASKFERPKSIEAPTYRVN